MSKTIIITERQLHEILGSNSSYLDNTEGDFNEYNGHTEISASGKLSDKTDAEPITTDEYTKNLAKRDNWFGRGKGNALVSLTCGIDKKKTLKEANSAAQGKTWYIPDDIYAILQQNLQNFNGDKNASGWDRLNNLINKRNVEYSEMKRLKSFFEGEGKNDQAQMNLIGGNRMCQWVKNSLNSFRTAVSNDKANRKAMGFQNVYQKAGGTKTSGNGLAHTPKTNNGITYQE